MAVIGTEHTGTVVEAQAAGMDRWWHNGIATYGVEPKHDVRVCVKGTYLGGGEYRWYNDTFPLYAPGLLDQEHAICVKTPGGPKEIELCDHWPPQGVNGWGTLQVKVADGPGGERWAVPYAHYLPGDCHNGVVLAGDWGGYYEVPCCRIFRKTGSFWRPRIVGPWRYPDDLGLWSSTYVDEFLLDDQGVAHMTWRCAMGGFPLGTSARHHTAWDVNGNIHGPNNTGNGLFIHNRSGDCWRVEYDPETKYHNCYHSDLTVDGPGDWQYIGYMFFGASQPYDWGPRLFTPREYLIELEGTIWYHLYEDGVRWFTREVCEGDVWHADYLTNAGVPMCWLGDETWWTRWSSPSEYWDRHHVRTEGEWGVPDENRDLRRLYTHELGGSGVYFTTPTGGYLKGPGEYRSGGDTVSIGAGIYTFQHEGVDGQGRDLWSHAGPVWTQPHPHEYWAAMLKPRCHYGVTSSWTGCNTISEDGVIVCQVAMRSSSGVDLWDADKLGLVYLPSGEMELVAGLDGVN